jgi:hypothetical protein
LRGCEARIFGRSDEAIISVNSDSSKTRQRFSVAHELGHWHHHRGQLLFCRSSDIGENSGRSQAEKVANKFAADLLMPGFLFDPHVAAIPKLTFSSLVAVARDFRVSRTAAAIRAVERGHAPAVLVCHTRVGLKWFVRSPLVSDRWWPNKEMSADSAAFGVQFGSKNDDLVSRKIRAGAWFNGREADRFSIHEETIRSGTDETLTLLVLDDRKMLAD